jgi:hypothetical protein
MPRISSDYTVLYVDFHHITCYYNLKDRSLHRHQCKKLRIKQSPENVYLMPNNQLIQQTTHSYIPWDRNVHNHCHSYKHSPISHLSQWSIFGPQNNFQEKLATTVYCSFSPPSPHIPDKIMYFTDDTQYWGPSGKHDNPNLKGDEICSSQERRYLYIKRQFCFYTISCDF